MKDMTSLHRTTKRIGSLKWQIKHQRAGTSSKKTSAKQVKLWKHQLKDELALRENLRAKASK